MAQPPSELDILLSELSDMSGEVKTRVEQRNYMTEVMAVLVAGIITAVATSASATNTDNLLILGIVPFITAFFLRLIKSSYNRHRLLTRHIIEIENKLNDELTQINLKKVKFWETSFKETNKTNRRDTYNLFNISTLLFCGGIFSVFAFPTLSMAFGDCSFLNGSSLALLIIGSYGFIGGLAVFSSLIRQEDLYDYIDLTDPRLKLGYGEFLEGQITYTQLGKDSQFLGSNPRIKGSLLLTNYRIFFVHNVDKSIKHKRIAELRFLFFNKYHYYDDYLGQFDSTKINYYMETGGWCLLSIGGYNPDKTLEAIKLVLQ